MNSDTGPKTKEGRDRAHEAVLFLWDEHESMREANDLDDEDQEAEKYLALRPTVQIPSSDMKGDWKQWSNDDQTTIQQVLVIWKKDPSLLLDPLVRLLWRSTKERVPWSQSWMAQFALEEYCDLMEPKFKEWVQKIERLSPFLQSWLWKQDTVVELKNQIVTTESKDRSLGEGMGEKEMTVMILDSRLPEAQRTTPIWITHLRSVDSVARLKLDLWCAMTGVVPHSRRRLSYVPSDIRFVEESKEVDMDMSEGGGQYLYLEQLIKTEARRTGQCTLCIRATTPSLSDRVQPWTRAEVCGQLIRLWCEHREVWRKQWFPTLTSSYFLHREWTSSLAEFQLQIQGMESPHLPWHSQRERTWRDRILAAMERLQPTPVIKTAATSAVSPRPISVITSTTDPAKTQQLDSGADRKVDQKEIVSASGGDDGGDGRGARFRRIIVFSHGNDTASQTPIFLLAAQLQRSEITLDVVMLGDTNRDELRALAFATGGCAIQCKQWRDACDTLSSACFLSMFARHSQKTGSIIPHMSLSHPIRRPEDVDRLMKQSNLCMPISYRLEQEDSKRPTLAYRVILESPGHSNSASVTAVPCPVYKEGMDPMVAWLPGYRAVFDATHHRRETPLDRAPFTLPSWQEYKKTTTSSALVRPSVPIGNSGWIQRIRQEWENIRGWSSGGKDRIEVHVGLNEKERVDEWLVIVSGPPACLYTGGTWVLSIHFPRDFPTVPPIIRFLTPIEHMQVTADGWMCLSSLSTWNAPSSSVLSILQEILEAFNVPRTLRALRMSLLADFYRDPSGYRATIRKAVETYATREMALAPFQPFLEPTDNPTDTKSNSNPIVTAVRSASVPATAASVAAAITVLADGKCGQCGKERAPQLCGRCRQVHYCSVSCQRQHWATHKVQCRSK